MQENSKAARSLLRDERGNLSIIFALMIVPVTAMAGAAADYGNALRIRSKLQSAADAAAIAASSMAEDASSSERSQQATQTFQANATRLWPVVAQPSVSVQGQNVTVTASVSVDTNFMKLMRVNKLPVNVKAAAAGGYSQQGGAGKACIIGLDPSSDNGIHMQGTNLVRNENCWGYTNSEKPTAINAAGSNANAVGLGYCAVGGYDAPHGNYSPRPETGCPVIADPFAWVGAYEAGRAYSAKFSTPTMPSTCKGSSMVLKKGTYTLDPGRYCGGLDIKAHATVTLNPGIYIMDNGVFNVQSGGSVQGSNVLFYFTGNNASMTVIGGGTVNLKGRSSGQSYAGFLFIAHPDANRFGVSNIQGGGTFLLEGVLYMPTQTIYVSGDGDVNGNAKYFAMIAKDFDFRGNGIFRVKANEGESNLPDLLPDRPVVVRNTSRLM